MNSLTIRKKLILVFAILIAAFVGSGIYSAYSLSSINEGALRIATEHLQGVMAAAESSRSMSDYRQGEFAVLNATTLPNKIHAAQETKKLADQIDITFNSVEPKLAGSDVANDFSEMRQSWDRYKQNSKQLIQLAKAGQIQEATKLLENSNNDYAKIEAKLNRILDNRKDSIHMETVQASARYNQTRVILIVSIVIVVAFSIFMALGLSASIMKSIKYLMNVSKELAAGNLTVEAKSETKDEFGELTEVYAETIETLRKLIQKIQQNAKDASTFAAQLNENASQSALATQQVAVSIGNVAENANKQGDAVAASAHNIRAFAKVLQGFEEKASSSVSAAKSVEEIAAEGKSAVEGAVEQMSAIAESTAASAEVIKKLSDRSAAIGDISSTIAGIAEQTNLLALNAAIEAARAGEAGKGFAVVADEVRKLAEGSNIAAQKIGELIEKTNSDTEKAVTEMQKGTATVENGKAIVAAAGSSFENIAAAVSDLTTHAEDILVDAQKASQRIDKLVASMDELDQSSKDVSAETESVSAATEEQSASIDEVATASKKLSELAEELQSSAAQFKIYKGADRIRPQS